jgi:exopolysaccharide biosynthesis polyprenyl glycosylphosphotransferase
VSRASRLLLQAFIPSVGSKLTSDPAPAVAVDSEVGGPEAAVAAIPLPLPAKREEATLGPGDLRGRKLRRLLLAADIVALCGAFLSTQAVSGVLALGDVPLLLASIPVWVVLAYGHRLYHLDSYRADYGAADEIGPVLQMVTLWSWTTLLALSAVRSDHVPVSQVALFWAVTLVLLMVLRAAIRAYATRQVWYLQNAVIMGPVKQASAILQKILRHPEWGINVVACVETPGGRRTPGRAARLFDLVPVLRGDADVVELVKRLDVDRVVLAPALSESRRRMEVVCELSELGVHVDLVPSWSDVVGARLDLHEMEGTPLLTMPRPRLGRTSVRLKRALDLVVGTLALVFLAPLLAACVIAIKLDSPGPVLFRQRRIGRDERPFELLKFRSMHVDADSRKDDIARLNLHGGGIHRGMFKIREDPRVTRVGRFLRRYSLDELPQVFNILRGEMSFVGPRPLIETEDRQIEGRFRRRLSLAPGLTGLWQAHGRSDIPFEQMVNLDYLYVTNWSLWGDVKLVMRTVSAVLRGNGAY